MPTSAVAGTVSTSRNGASRGDVQPVAVGRRKHRDRPQRVRDSGVRFPRLEGLDSQSKAETRGQNQRMDGYIHGDR